MQIFDGDKVIVPDSEVNNFYLIKHGKIKLMDRYYNYMLELESGSYFGEVEVMFGLLSAHYYNNCACNHHHDDGGSDWNMLYAINGKKFLEILSQDFATFKHFFDSALQRFRFLKQLRKLTKQKMIVEQGL